MKLSNTQQLIVDLINDYDDQGHTLNIELLAKYNKKIKELNEKVLFADDQEKIEDAVEYHTMGSYQAGEVARLSASLYDKGIDVVGYLENLNMKFT